MRITQTFRTEVARSGGESVKEGLGAQGRGPGWSLGNSSAAEDSRVDLIFSLFQVQPSNLISKQNPIGPSSGTRAEDTPLTLSPFGASLPCTDP